MTGGDIAAAKEHGMAVTRNYISQVHNNDVNNVNNSSEEEEEEEEEE